MQIEKDDIDLLLDTCGINYTKPDYTPVRLREYIFDNLDQPFDVLLTRMSRW